MMRSAMLLVRGGRCRLRAVDCARALADWETDWMTLRCAIEAEVEELSGGVEAVAGFGIIDLALHDVDEETDY